MVKVKDTVDYQSDGSIDVEAWLKQISTKPLYADSSLLRNSVLLTQLSCVDHATRSGRSCLQEGLAIAEILADLDLDVVGLAAAIAYQSVQYAELSLDIIQEQLGDPVTKLIDGLQRMETIHSLQRSGRQNHSSQIENIRKMLLAMVDDVRVVLIALAQRLQLLRTANHLSPIAQRELAQESMDIYAPLANRLGVGQLKWEMEDLSFRYLMPTEYKTIAKALKSRRLERDAYVKNIVAILTDAIHKLGITDAKVYGRSKHIHSIYRKMQRKNLQIEQIYDTTAVRVLTEDVSQCYAVLSLVHETWERLPEEFDDYIANPKSNGYRSLHTAVIGPGDQIFEVQIRTFAMHNEAELGVAAHWAYKEEAAVKKSAHERKIDWLREILAWQKEISAQNTADNTLQQEFLEDRIYVFTPTGDIIDLSRGATPLDFAYAIHSQVGHRCRGAKINGKIVQLVHTLHTGDQVEILTAKNGSPSRDWLNPHLGYITTARAKAKIHHWFKSQEYDRHLEEGKELFEKEYRKLNLEKVSIEDIARKLHYKKSDDLFAALGRSDLRMSQITNMLTTEEPTKSVTHAIPVISKPHKVSKGLNIHGVGNLLTTMARCCNPVPGEPIVGYITLNRGITIHRKDCPNVLDAMEKKQQRLLDVSWGDQIKERFTVQIQVLAYERAGLINDITSRLTHDKINLLGMNTRQDPDQNTTLLTMSLEIDNLTSLSKILDKIKQISHVIECNRVTS